MSSLAAAVADAQRAGARATTAPRPVRLDAAGSPVLVGSGALEALTSHLAGYRRIVAVTSAPLVPLLDASNIAADATLLVPDGESAKSLATVETLGSELARLGADRSDVLLAFGGGATTDVVGLTAALYHRGIDLAVVPTTLVGQIDAAIGGKTAVNLLEGKNLLGVVRHAALTVIDPGLLDSLPDREFRSGLGELARYALFGDLHSDPSGLLELIDAHAGRLTGRDPAVLEDAVVRCAAIKAAIVSVDPDERGPRVALNYGHTLAHALETTTGHRLSHGEAVAVGLAFAAELAHALGLIDDDLYARHHDVLDRLGLGRRAPALSADLLVEVMARDKKTSLVKGKALATGRLTFLLHGASGLTVVSDPDPSTLRSALLAVGCI